MSKRIFISVQENADLIRVSNGRPLGLSFGPRGVWLADDCKWPLTYLAEWRGLTFKDGAGI